MSSNNDLAPAPADRPKTFGGLLSGVLNFTTLSARFTALATSALFLKENLHLLKQRMRDAAAHAHRVGELCGQAGVDTHFVALFTETAQHFDRVAAAAGELADAADQMATHAGAVHDAHETEYRGIYEVRQASEYEQPKPAFNTVR